MKKIAILLWAASTFCISVFSEITPPLDKDFYSKAIIDMVNVYDTLYNNNNKTHSLYLQVPDSLLDKFTNRIYNIKGHKVQINNELEIEKIIKNKGRLSFTTFYPSIKDTVLMQIYVSFRDGIYRKGKIKAGVAECAFFNLIYEYNYNTAKWVYLGYQRCRDRGTYPQKKFNQKINKFGNKNQKQGLWITTNSYYIDYTYFNEGKPNGISYRLDKSSNHLVFLCEYTDGEYSGTYYKFSTDGNVESVYTDFSNNKDSVLWISSNNATPTLIEKKCYCINYYLNGNKKSEGILLLGNDAPYLINYYEFGEWKYYDDTGKLTETKLFK